MKFVIVCSAFVLRFMLFHCFLFLQLERKRHIGNDIVVIVFVDGENPELAYESCLTFNPSSMKSHFNHIFALVMFDQTKNAYRHVEMLCVHAYMYISRTSYSG